MNCGKEYIKHVDDKTTPTQKQITNILEPFRPIYYRAVASVLEGGICLRLDYSDDERSHQFWDKELDDAVVEIEAVVVDDKGVFGVYSGTCAPEGEGSDCFRKALRLMPEIVTWLPQTNEELALDSMRKWRDTDDDEERKSLEQQVRGRFAAGTIFVEDLRTHSDERNSYDGRQLVLQVLFDSYGNLVCSERVTVEDAEILNAWQLFKREQFVIFESEHPGPEYRPGGKIAPPYSQFLELEGGIDKLNLPES